MSEATANASNGRGSPLGQIRTLFALGSLGALDDARLLELFLERNGTDAEDAFAAIVRRHGPMVLGVCRRMLDESHNADDAFQATFLILARRASAIGRKERLSSWLHGVAVRAAKEIRRGEARRHTREAQAMQETRAESNLAEAETDSDVLALLDEELARLPERTRAPLLLCEIEGKSRHDAARQLGISEGTLSSRLARGRKLLRDRLAARGVNLGMVPLTDRLGMLSMPHLPESLALSTTRAAAGSMAGGATSAVVIAVAERVLKTMLLAKLKAGLVGALVVGLGSILTATFAGAGGTPAPQGDGAVVVQASRLPADAKARRKGEHDPRFARAKGVVVDEAGKPVPGVKVTMFDFRDSRPSGMTDEAGAFDFDSGVASLDHLQLLVATTTDGLRQGLHAYSLGTGASRDPAKIVLKPSRKLLVHVVDRAKQPVAGAIAEIFAGRWRQFSIADAKTEPSGNAVLRIPADAQVRWITAFKSGIGFDHDMIWRHGDDRPLKELPDAVDLMLDGARTVTVKAVGSSGKPIPNVPIYPFMLSRAGKEQPNGVGRANMSGSLAVRIKTNARGIATFDWLPETKRHLIFFANDDRLDSPPADLRGESQDTSLRGMATEAFWDLRDGVSSWANGATLTMRLLRSEAIRGRVTRPDGRPAAGIRLYARGFAWGGGRGGADSSAEARTAADGTYEMIACANQAYSIAVLDHDWAAPSRFGTIVREGKPAEAVDFRLQRGTLLHGIVTEGPDRKPKDGGWVTPEETGNMPPELPNPNGETLRVDRFAQTYDRGRYSIRLGPGTFKISGSSAVEGSDTITVTDEDVLERDIHLP